MLLRRLSQTKLALGSDVTLAIVTDMSDDLADKLFVALWRQVYLFERRFSRFLLSSELTTFNRATGLKNPISSEFKELLMVAKQFGIETGGLYNPFVTPALQNAGYKKSALPGYENDKQIDYSNRRVVANEKLEIGDTWALMPYNTAIDLGGIGKGYLADKIGEILHKFSVQGYWLSFGGDISTFGMDENGNNITLDIQNANNLNFTTNWIINCPTNNFAIATSGAMKRVNQEDDGDWHHIIDPATLKPAKSDIKMATVCADTVTRADVLASCAIILGSKKAPAFLKKHGVKSALLQCIDENGVLFEKKFGSNISKMKLYQSREFAVNA